jgi:hypothetical protein
MVRKHPACVGRVLRLLDRCAVGLLVRREGIDIDVLADRRLANLAPRHRPDFLGLRSSWRRSPTWA